MTDRLTCTVQNRIADVRLNGVPQREPVATLTAPVDLRTEPDRRAEVAPGSEFHRQWVAARTNGPVRISSFGS